MRRERAGSPLLGHSFLLASLLLPPGQVFVGAGSWAQGACNTPHTHTPGAPPPAGHTHSCSRRAPFPLPPESALSASPSPAPALAFSILSVSEVLAELSRVQADARLPLPRQPACPRPQHTERAYGLGSSLPGLLLQVRREGRPWRGGRGREDYWDSGAQASGSGVALPCHRALPHSHCRHSLRVPAPTKAQRMRRKACQCSGAAG